MLKRQDGGRRGAGAEYSVHFLFAILMAGSHNPASAQAPKTLDRIHEPVVGTAEEFQVDEFLARSISGFEAWRYRLATSSWEQVPLQIDQRYNRDFGELVPCRNGKPECACAPDPTCGVCELSYVWDGEADPVDGTALDANDEIVFLAKDTGDRAPDNSAPAGRSGSQRYRIRVGHPASGYGWLYLHWHSLPSSTPKYVTLSTSGEGASRQTSFKVCAHPLLAGLDGYQIGLRGNWSLNELRVDSIGTNPDCGVTYSTLDMVDRVKWRMGGEGDELWNQTSIHLGTIDGKVRAMSGSLGAASGFGTTHYYRFYPTWFEDEVHLRVHDLTHAIKGYTDWMRAATGQGEQACPVQNFQFWRLGNSTSPEDHIDGGCWEPSEGFPPSAFEARQLNGPYVSLVELVQEDPQHPMPSAKKEMYYIDFAGAPLESGLELEAGAYGNVGIEFSPPTSTEEQTCSEVKFAAFSRFWQIAASDSGFNRAEILNRNLVDRPLQITSHLECPSCGSPPGPVTPCKPTLNASDPGVGYYSDLSVGSPCGTVGLWFQAYRSVGTSGPFELIAELRTATVFKDFNVERGQTYRYYVQSYNADGVAGEPSDMMPITVTDTTPPAAPSISGSCSGSTATLSWEWTRDYDLIGYNIYRATQSGGPYTKLTLGGPLREQGFTGQLQPAGTTYYFVVKAVDAAGLESTASNEVVLTGV